MTLKTEIDPVEMVATQCASAILAIADLMSMGAGISRGIGGILPTTPQQDAALDQLGHVMESMRAEFGTKVDGYITALGAVTQHCTPVDLGAAQLSIFITAMDGVCAEFQPEKRMEFRYHIERAMACYIDGKDTLACKFNTSTGEVNPL